MAKIKVPQELVDQIINLYVNQNKTRVEIKRELNLTFDDSVIKRILEENNIPIRSNPGAKAGGRKPEQVDKDLQNKIIELYNAGTSRIQIVKKLHLPFGEEKVKNILKAHGVRIRSSAEANAVSDNKPELRKYKVNDDYRLESHNGAWLLGFIAADGYLPITKGALNRITISLAAKDRDVLELIAKEIGYTGPIYDYESNGFPAVSLSFASRKLREQIESYGIGNNKTFKLKHLPNLPDKYLLDFIRGYFDGDGSVFKPKDKRIGMNITCASRSFLVELTTYLHEHYNVALPTLHEQVRVHPVYSVNYYVADSLMLGKLFYDNDYLALPRKKSHYFELAIRE